MFLELASIPKKPLMNLLGLSKLAQSDPTIASIDVNPLIVSPSDGRPLAVDALVEMRA